MKDPYVYEGTDVLINKLGITDKDELDVKETDITVANIATIKDVDGCYDFEHLKAMHKHIFGDIYEWAGEERTVPIEKAEKVLNGLSVEYAYPKNIEKQATEAIAMLNSVNWCKLNDAEKAENLAADVAKLWQAHAFREGNTRTTITFACEYAEAQGFKMDKELLAKNSGFVRTSLVMASIGEYSEPQHLARIFKDSIERGNSLAMEKPPESNGQPKHKKSKEIERD